jgi:DNA-binding IclR family transcriptional regulator
MNETDDDDYAVPGLARGMRILEYLAEHPEGKSQKEISDTLGFPFSSVSRTTLQLESMGYLRRDSETKLFRHTMKMLMVGQRALSEYDLVGMALPEMRKLRDLLGDTIVLGVLNDTDIIVIESAPGTHLFKFTLDAGHRINIPASAPGKAILAFLPDDQRDKVVRKLRFTRFNERTITNRVDFLKELAEVRRLGYALDRGEEYSGIYCAGAPVLDRNGYPVASIWVTGPDVRVKPEQLPFIGERVHSGAAAISTLLGYRVTGDAN